MSLVTGKQQAREVIDSFVRHGASMAVFCTASHWNTEAILLAASRYAERHRMGGIALSVAMTFNYPHMPQATRMTYGGNPKEGFLSNMEHLRILCGSPDSTYSGVTVLPHLDHADPAADNWALTEGLPYLASVMFDAQKYPYAENMAMTADYVEKHGESVLVEGIMDGLGVEGHSEGQGGSGYVEKAVEYVSRTGVDFLVADLGTEQQTTVTGRHAYWDDRANALTRALGKPMLALHGTSCLSGGQMAGLAGNGIVRVNMWTRIAREAGQYAASRIAERASEIARGGFEAAESRQYLRDSVEKAASIMEDVLELIGYARFSQGFQPDRLKPCENPSV